MGARARIIFAVSFAAFAMSEAAAQSNPTPVAYHAGSPSSAFLTIPVTASVGGRCGFATAPSGTHNEPNFDDHSWQHDFNFVLDCSGPSRVAVVSTNGALKAPGSVPVGYTTLAPYDVMLSLQPNAGAPTTASCAVANLTSGGSCSFVGPASTSQGLRLATPSTTNQTSFLRVSAPAYTGANVLVASNSYADTLIVTLSAAP